jgi:hypothetical protein
MYPCDPLKCLPDFGLELLQFTAGNHSSQGAGGWRGSRGYKCEMRSDPESDLVGPPQKNNRMRGPTRKTPRRVLRYALTFLS